MQDLNNCNTESLEKIEKLKNLIKESNNIVFFGGAGVSTESGIPDFRSNTGIYNNQSYKYPPEVILSHSFFISHTKDFFEFYKSKMIYSNAKPNYAHIALAKLEEEGKTKAIITQNIDGLHQMAGSNKVLELHGSIYSNHCIKCNKYFDLNYIINSIDIPICDQCGGIVKPDVVLYEENLDEKVLYNSMMLISNADMLIVAGTSLNVYPAAGLLRYYNGNKLILINKSKTNFDNMANLCINDSVAKIFKQCVN